MWRRIVLFISTLIITSGVYAKTEWQQLAPGIFYTSINYTRTVGLGVTGKLHAFKIDLRRYKLEISSAKDLQRTFANVFSLTANKNALIGINGGFFTPQMQPLGLRISNGKMTNRLKRTRWWGVFQIRNNYPKILSLKDFQFNRKIDFAIQTGPRLVVHGQIPNLKGGDDNRSALGITKQKELIIVATQNLPMTTTELAEVMRANSDNDGLGCTDAINLDGGSSTQLYANISGFYLNVPSFAPVSDAVVVVRR